MKEIKDYTGSGFRITLLVIAMLVCVSFVPAFRIGGMVVKRANILSDVVSFKDEGFPSVSGGVTDDDEDCEPVPVQEVVDATGVTEAETGGEITVGEEDLSDLYSIPVIDDPAIVQIKDYSPSGRMMPSFYHALAYETESRPVRIAVLGDSFIEADIITADMREQLQLLYGGNGVGFVPFSTPLSKYRGTVTHNHDGWATYNLIKRKSVPEEYKDWFFVSGMVSVPKESAYTEYKGVQFRRRIEKTNGASLYFINRRNTLLDVTVNGKETYHYEPDSGAQVQRICISEPDIAAVEIRLTDPEGFIGYGVVLEDSVGVSVHNFSVRSNSGLALLGTAREINRQFDRYMAYDLLILQYGLNAMSADVTDYNYYEKQLVKIVNYIKECFPGRPIVIMSVGDRSTMQNGTAVTMPAVKAMVRAQERAAAECGVGFWNTYEAMGGDNSMPKFVERQWAAKDYTHIGYPGGKYIAGQFVRFIEAAVESVRTQDRDRAEARRLADPLDISRVPGGEVVIDGDTRSKLSEISEGAYSFGEYGGDAGNGESGSGEAKSAAGAQTQDSSWTEEEKDMPSFGREDSQRADAAVAGLQSRETASPIVSTGETMSGGNGSSEKSGGEPQAPSVDTEEERGGEMETQSFGVHIPYGNVIPQTPATEYPFLQVIGGEEAVNIEDNEAAPTGAYGVKERLTVEDSAVRRISKRTDVANGAYPSPSPDLTLLKRTSRIPLTAEDGMGSAPGLINPSNRCNTGREV